MSDTLQLHLKNRIFGQSINLLTIFLLLFLWPNFASISFFEEHTRKCKIHLIGEGSTLICKICTFHAKWHHNSSSHFTQLLDSFVFFLKFFASSRGFKKRISFVCFNKCLVVCGWFCLFKIRYFSVIYTRSRNRPSSNTWRQSPRRCCWWSKIFFWWYPYCWSRLTPNYILHFGINVFDCIFLNYGCRMKHEIKNCQWQIW